MGRNTKTAPSDKRDPNDLVPMPSTVRFFNANAEPCDMLIGPCACGSWHQLNDWTPQMLAYISEQ